uniref:Uncharacterized protein n=1 Tax=Wuchereria bancrofti TaxID=6293 RepID=A0AAF5PKX1_WUCBA
MKMVFVIKENNSSNNSKGSGGVLECMQYAETVLVVHE